MPSALSEQSSSLRAHLAHAAALDNQAASARTALAEALTNLLQSQQPTPRISAATRATLAKRALSQLEMVSDLMTEASSTATRVHHGAIALRTNLRPGQRFPEEPSAISELTGLAGLAEATSGESTDRLRTEAKAARNAAAVDKARALAAVEAAAAVESRAANSIAQFEHVSAAHAESSAEVSRLSAQLEKEREVLARLAAENVLFVKQVQHAESERERAERERTELQTKWRAETEAWFESATVELQNQLLTDWGASRQISSDLKSAQEHATRERREHATATDALRTVCAEQESQLEQLRDELGRNLKLLSTTRDRLARVQEEGKALRERDMQMSAQNAAAKERIRELTEAEERMRNAGDATLHIREALLAEQHGANQLRERLRVCEEQLALSRAVCERVREEAAAEHTASLEALARSDMMEAQVAALQREKEAWISSVEAMGLPQPVR